MEDEFAELRAMHAHVLRASVVYILMCLCASMVYVPTY